MATDWGEYIIIVLPSQFANAEPHQTNICNAIVNGGSGESLADELLMFDNVLEMSATGSAPAVGVMLSLPAKLAMTSALEAIVEALPPSAFGAFYMTRSQFTSGLLRHNLNHTPDAANFGLTKALAAINTHKGTSLQFIPKTGGV